LPDSLLATAVGADFKGKVSPLCVAVALMWLVPDRRIERVLASHDPKSA